MPENNEILTIHTALRRYRGAFQEVVDRSVKLKPNGYHRAHLYKVMKGYAQNDELVALAAEVLRQRQEREDRTMETISNAAARAAARGVRVAEPA